MSELADRSGTALLAVTLRVSLRSVSVVRRFVDALADTHDVSADLSARVAMTAHELLENVAKFATDGRGSMELHRKPHGAGSQFVLSVANRTAPHHLDRVRSLFEEMHAAADPTDLYCALMQRPVSKGQSGLGLARIEAEGNMKLSLAIAGDLVTISATSEAFMTAQEPFK